MHNEKHTSPCQCPKQLRLAAGRAAKCEETIDTEAVMDPLFWVPIPITTDSSRTRESSGCVCAKTAHAHVRIKKMANEYFFMFSRFYFPMQS